MNALRSYILVVLFLFISAPHASFQYLNRPVWLDEPGAMDTTFSCHEEVEFPVPNAVSPRTGKPVHVELKNKYQVFGKCKYNYRLDLEYIAIDVQGNSSIPYWVKVKVVDYTPPIWDLPFYSLDTIYTCAQDMILPSPPSASDNCPGQEVTIRLYEEMVHEGVCPNQFTRTYTYVAQDGCGNVSIPFNIHIIVNDDIGPRWDFTPGQLDTSFNHPDLFEFPRLPVAIDNCSGNPLRVIKASDIRISIAGPTDYIRKLGYEAHDGCGNTSERYDVLVTIRDTSLAKYLNP